MQYMFKGVIIGFLLFTINPLLAQDLKENLANQMCSCFEEEGAKSFAELDPCILRVLDANESSILEYYKAESVAEVNVEEMMMEVGAVITLNCEYIIPYLEDPESIPTEADVQVDDLDCSDLYEGNYYYVQSVELDTHQKISDTTRVTFSKDAYVEYLSNGRYSKLGIEWTDPCSFTLTFKESNDPFKRTLSKEGDIYTYQVINSDEQSFTLITEYRGRRYKFNLIKEE